MSSVCMCDGYVCVCECSFVFLCADVLHVSVTSAVWIAHCSGRSRPRSRLIGVVGSKCAHWRVLCISGLRCRVPLIWLAESVWGVVCGGVCLCVVGRERSVFCVPLSVCVMMMSVDVGLSVCVLMCCMYR